MEKITLANIIMEALSINTQWYCYITVTLLIYYIAIIKFVFVTIKLHSVNET